MTKRLKYAPRPASTEAAIAELEALPQISDGEITLTLEEVEALMAPPPEPETISVTDLTLLSFLPRFERIANACEVANAFKTIHKDDITGLTQQVHRLADAFEAMAGLVGCITESVKSDEDGAIRGYVRVRDDNHDWFLASRDGRED
jgi:hypothetical protein